MNLVTSPVRFNSEAHAYTLGERYLSGITGLIDRKIFGGKYSNTDSFFLQKYAEYGQLVHSELDSWFTMEITPTTPEAIAFAQWFDENYSTAQTATEYTVSDEKAFATNIDLVTAGGIWDYKTTKDLDIERVRWQLSVSAYLFELQNGYTPEHLYVAHLRGDVCKVKEVFPIEREKVLELLAQTDLEAISNTNELQRLVDIEQALITLQIEATRLETLKADVLTKIEIEMERTGTKKIDTDRLMITRVLPTTAERIDTKRLEAENPDLCQRYKVTTEKKGFVRLTIKK